MAVSMDKLMVPWMGSKLDMLMVGCLVLREVALKGVQSGALKDDYWVRMKVQ
jgi:hypothetical protein